MKKLDDKGLTMEQIGFFSEPFAINNGLDLVVPEFLEAQEED